MLPMNLNVLVLAPQPEASGALTAFSFLEEEVCALARSGLKTHVLSDGPRVDSTQAGVYVHRIPYGRRGREVRDTIRFILHRVPTLLRGPARGPLRKLYHFARLERYAADVVREREIDLIHSHFAWPGGFGGALASMDTGVPVVATFRGMDLIETPELDYGLRRDRFFRRALSVLLRQAKHTTYVSEFLRKQGLALGAREGSATVIRKGVDLAQFRPVADRTSYRQALGYPRPLILSVGGLIPLKGVAYTLRALRRLDEGQDFTFVVCGDGDERGNLERLAAELGIQDKVHFVGRVPRDEIARYFAATDLFVHSALWEAAGNVLVEAMASGRPIVCSDAGGPSEYVVDGETGFVVPPGDVDRLAGKIQFLLRSPGVADKMGARGRQRAENHFSYEGMISQIAQVYHDALAG